MPTYDYLCKSCQAEFEVFHGMTEQPVVACPSCGGSDTARLLTGGGGLIFKGSGFYITDYKGASAANAAKSESGESKPAAKDATSKSEPAASATGKESGGEGKKSTPAPAPSSTAAAANS